MLCAARLFGGEARLLGAARGRSPASRQHDEDDERKGRGERKRVREFARY